MKDNTTLSNSVTEVATAFALPVEAVHGPDWLSTMVDSKATKGARIAATEQAGVRFGAVFACHFNCHSRFGMRHCLYPCVHRSHPCQLTRWKLQGYELSSLRQATG
jgi:hypothetical protein